MAINRVEVTKIDNLKFKMRVCVLPERLTKEIQKRLKNVAAKVNIPGFRPGKVPMSVVRRRYADDIRNEVVSELLRSTCLEAIEQEKLIPASQPIIHIIQAEEGNELEYEATFEIYPTIEPLQSLADIEMQGYMVEIADQDVDDIIAKLRKQQAQWLPVDRPAQQGDQVLIDFSGLMEGQSFEGGSGKQVLLELGSGAAIPDFEEGLVGASAKQDPIDLSIRFPEKYYRKELAGKLAQISIIVHKVSEPKLPELDATFAKKLGIVDGTIDHLKAEVRKNMERDIERAVKNQLKEQILAKFVELQPTIDLPTSLVEEEAKKLRQQAEQNLSQRKEAQLTPSSTPEQKKPHLTTEQFMNVAAQRVRLGLLFGEFIRTHDLKLDTAKVHAALQELAASYDDPSSVIAWYRNSKEQMEQIHTAVMEEQVVEELIKQAKITYKSIPYLEFIAQRRI